MAITMEELKRKAKAYDEALESAKEIVNNQNASSVWKDWLRNTFPELKENKGEEIRKNIISYLHNEKKVKRYISDIEFDKWIDWLEKQGSNNIKWNKNTKDNKPQVNHSVLMQTIYGIAEGEWKGEGWYQYRWSGIIKDNAVIAWIELSDIKKKELKKLSQQEVTKISDQEKDFIEVPFGAKDSEFIVDTYFIPEGCYAVIVDDMVVIKKGERKPAWNEEDEHKVKDTIYFLDTAKKHYASTVELDACIDWLKSLKDKVQPQSQPKQEWSGEDECYMSECISAIATKDKWSFEEKRKTKLWLFSLKQRIGG